MRVINFGINQGSLLRRTILHVAAFVVGSCTVIGVLSFVSVSVAKGVLAPSATAASATSTPAEAGARAPNPLDPQKGRLPLKSRLDSRSVRVTGQDG